MQQPAYVNAAEIQTYSTLEEGNMVIIRFLYREPKLQKPETLNRPGPLVFVGPAVLMPRKSAEAFLKRFLGFMAVQNEHKKGV